MTEFPGNLDFVLNPTFQKCLTNISIAPTLKYYLWIWNHLMIIEYKKNQFVFRFFCWDKCVVQCSHSYKTTLSKGHTSCWTRFQIFWGSKIWLNCSPWRDATPLIRSLFQCRRGCLMRGGLALLVFDLWMQYEVYIYFLNNWLC
jgi:hypothetical protein